MALRLGVPARLIDPGARTVELADGDVLGYDDLVLATGSRPFVPPVPGTGLAGVHVFRTRADARSLLKAAAGAKRAVVIGGGLLGLEAARGLRERGVAVTVVHLADRLMEQQLDAPAASLLERALRDLRIGVRTGARTDALTGTGRVERVLLDGGEELPADLVVIAAGIRPDVDLARTSASSWVARSSSTTSCARARPGSAPSASAPSTAERSTACGRRCSSRRGRSAPRSPGNQPDFSERYRRRRSRSPASSCSAAVGSRRASATRRCWR